MLWNGGEDKPHVCFSEIFSSNNLQNNQVNVPANETSASSIIRHRAGCGGIPGIIDTNIVFRVIQNDRRG
jgi:hypothetical protein